MLHAIPLRNDVANPNVISRVRTFWQPTFFFFFFFLGCSLTFGFSVEMLHCSRPAQVSPKFLLNDLSETGHCLETAFSEAPKVTCDHTVPVILEVDFCTFSLLSPPSSFELAFPVEENSLAINHFCIDIPLAAFLAVSCHLFKVTHDKML